MFPITFPVWIVGKCSKERMRTKNTEKWSILNSFKMKYEHPKYKVQFIPSRPGNIPPAHFGFRYFVRPDMDVPLVWKTVKPLGQWEKTRKICPYES